MINAVDQSFSDIEPPGSGASTASPCIVQDNPNMNLGMVTPYLEYTDYDNPLVQQTSVALSNLI